MGDVERFNVLAYPDVVLSFPVGSLVFLNVSRRYPFVPTRSLEKQSICEKEGVFYAEVRRFEKSISSTKGERYKKNNAL